MQSEPSCYQVERCSRSSFILSCAASFSIRFRFLSSLCLSKAVVKSSSTASSGRSSSARGISLNSSLTERQATIIITKRRILYFLETTSIFENFGLKGSFESKVPSSFIFVKSSLTFKASRLSRFDLFSTSNAPNIVRWRSDAIKDGIGGIVTKGN